jgi:hypothetical protein
VASAGLGVATTVADQAALAVATLVDVPIDVRVGGALETIISGAVAELAARYAVLAVALWPPAEVNVPACVVPVVRVERVGKCWPAEVRVAAVAAYRAGGGSYAVVGLRWGVPGTTVKDWVRRAASEYDLSAHADRRSSRGGIQSDRRRSG